MLNIVKWVAGSPSNYSATRRKLREVNERYRLQVEGIFASTLNGEDLRRYTQNLKKMEM